MGAARMSAPALPEKARKQKRKQTRKPASPPPPPIDEDEDEEVAEEQEQEQEQEQSYDVEAFLNCWTDDKKKTHFLVKWRGYPEEDATWHLSDQLKKDLGKAFDRLFNAMKSNQD